MRLEDIRIYNKDLELIHIIPRFVAANWEIKFSEYGTGEIELERSDEILKLLAGNQYLFLVQGDIQSIITGYKIGKNCVIFTRTLEWLLTRFVVKEVKKSDGLNGIVENILGALPKAFNLNFYGLESDDFDMSGYTFERATDVYSAVKSAIPDVKLGFSFRADFKNKEFTFMLNRAKENIDLLLCDEYKTSYESEYIYDIQSKAKGAHYYHDITYMGRWDPQKNEPELLVSPENYGHYYIVSNDGYAFNSNISKGDIIICKKASGEFEVTSEAEPFLVEIPADSDGIFSWSIMLNARNAHEAESELKQMKELNMLSMKTRLEYGTDYRLGDIIETKFYGKDIAISVKKLVSQIHLWVEREDSGSNPTIIDISEEE